MIADDGSAPGPSCDREGCTNEAKWMPKLLLRPPISWDVQAPVETYLAAHVCDDHKLVLTVKDLVDTNTWFKLYCGIKAAGFVPPVRDRTILKWVSPAENRDVWNWFYAQMGES